MTTNNEDSKEEVSNSLISEENINSAENEIDDDREQEKKRGTRRRKKKLGSEETDENRTVGRRIVICDQQFQMEIRQSQSICRASEILSNTQLDKVKTSGFCDFLVVSEL